MVYVDQPAFEALVHSYQIKPKDQAKIASVIMGKEQPPSKCPDSFDVTSSASFWRQVLGLWERRKERGLRAKTAGNTHEASYQKVKSGQVFGPGFSHLSNQADKNQKRTRDSPKVGQFSDLETLSSQSSDPATVSQSSDSEASPSQFSDPARVPEELSEKHRARHEMSAREYYCDPETMPSFVIRRSRDTERTVVIATATGLRPEFPTKAKIVFRKWAKSFGFWTLDLSGVRHILKSFPGGSNGGGHYKEWLGPRDNSDHEWKGPIAFSDFKSNRESTVSSEEEEQQEPFSNGLRSEENSVNSASAKSTPSRSDSEEILLPAKKSHPLNGTKRPVRSESMCRVELESPCSSGLENQTTVTSKSEADDSQRRSAGPLKRPYPTTPHTPAKRRKEASAHPSHTTQRKKTPSTTESAREEIVGKPNPSLHRSPAADFLNNTSTSTSLYKLEHTTLRFYLNGRTAFQAARLNSCLTTSQFFAYITKIFKLAIGDIVEVTVVFLWIEGMAEGREMEMRVGEEADMEILIEEVVNAPFWGTGTDRCIVNVHVRQAEIPVSRVPSVTPRTPYPKDE